MTYATTLDIGQASDLADWFAAHLPMDLRHSLMAERPVLYEALFPGCPHDAILGRVAAALRSQAQDRMVKTGQPAAAHLLRLIQSTDHPWEGSDTVDAIEQFLSLFGISAAEEAARADAIADAKRLLAERVLAAVPAEQRATVGDQLTDLVYLAAGSLDARARAELILATVAEGTGPRAQAA
jgi:hypothetical protein